MRYPTLRYGNPNELQFYLLGTTVCDVARRLRRSERTIENWLAGRERLPFWVPELLRLQKMESDLRMQQMRMRPVAAKLGIAAPDATLIEFKPRLAPIPPAEMENAPVLGEPARITA